MPSVNGETYVAKLILYDTQTIKAQRNKGAYYYFLKIKGVFFHFDS